MHSLDGLGHATVTVVGAGQAGLSAAHHLRLRGFAPAEGGARRAAADPSRDGAPPTIADPSRDGAPPTVADPSRDGAPPTVVVVDAGEAPGGAWRHRWESLRMATVNGIFDLPGMPLPPVDPAEPSRDAVPRYFAAYEEAEGLQVHRPVHVTSVEAVDDDPAGELRVASTAGSWTTSALVNATGTWDEPVLPDVPGASSFSGRQLHTRDHVSAAEFAGQRVAVVGGGISAVQLLDEISRVATTLWYTRREPVFLDHEFTSGSDGVDVERRVAEDAALGRPSRSIVSYTGLIWTDYARAARRRGALERRPMFTAMGPRHVVEADGGATSVDAVLWATGFRPSIRHLDGLDLRGPLGGVPLDGTRAARDRRVHLIGYGPSQSTVGANRAGRAAAREVARDLLGPRG